MQKIKPWSPATAQSGKGIHIFFSSFPPKSAQHLASTLKAAIDYGCQPKAQLKALSPLAPHLYYANTHEKRADDLIEAINNPDVSIIWAFAGGAGCTQLVHLIEKRGFIPTHQSPKLLVGFSDLTALASLWMEWGWPFLHAPCAGLSKESFASSQVAINTETTLLPTLDILTGKTTQVTYDLQVLHAPAGTTSYKGSLTGGNLTIVKETMGTSTELVGKERFIFLENVYLTSAAYLTREMAALLRAGFFKGARAIFFGILGIPEDEVPRFTEDFRETLALDNIDIPILHSNTFGHGPHNKPLPFGTPATITITQSAATITIDTNN